MTAVLNKQDFAARYKKGEFGNSSPTWATVEEFLEAHWSFDVTARYHLRNRVAGGPTYYDLPGPEVVYRYEACIAAGDKLGSYYVSQMAPNCYVLNAEVQQAPGGLWLTYSTINKPMREALAEKTQHASGLVANETLRYHLDPCDYDWLHELFDTYPDHVVELSHFQVPCGILNRRMIVWEVRKY